MTQSIIFIHKLLSKKVSEVSRPRRFAGSPRGNLENVILALAKV